MADQENQWQQALAAIDLTSIDALKTLKRDKDVLDQRLSAMDQLKKDVAEAVYQRVRGDYEKRERALDEQSTPLKQAARVQYAKLHELSARFEADHEAIRLDQQELELRHKLGEFDDPEFKRRLAAIEGTVKDKTAAREQALGLKARFLEAFHSEAELTADAATAGAPVPASDRFATLTGVDLAEMKTNEVSAVQSGPPNKTQVMTAIPDSVLAPVGGSTQVFRAARLVPQNPEAGKQSFALAIKPTSIGTDAGNDIRVGGPGVDPKHAQIAVNMGGFIIVDLASKHGTRVNGEKVRERQLRHEDVIQVGAARFVFREG
ncbi:MAG: FHA domain-containing protein [Rudaea sp.]